MHWIHRQVREWLRSGMKTYAVVVVFFGLAFVLSQIQIFTLQKKVKQLETNTAIMRASFPPAHPALPSRCFLDADQRGRGRNV